MTRLSLAASLLLAACAKGTPGPGPSHLGPELDIDTVMSVKITAAEFKCPAGTTMRPEQHAMVCYGDDGVRQGPASYWHENGELAGTGEFDHGVRDGLWRAWGADGKPRELSEHQGGKSHGRYVLWHDNGKRAVEGTVERGKRVGTWRTWYENGNQHEERTYVAGVTEGPVMFWHDNGKAWFGGTVAGGKKHGAWRAWDKDGKQTSLETFDHGVMHGPMTMWKDGSPGIQGQVARGKKDGSWRVWRPGGKPLIDEHWDKGVRHGRFMTYGELGDPQTDSPWIHGKRHGVWKRWNAGNLVGESSFADGVAHGTWRLRDAQGRILYEGQVDHGKRTGPWIERRGGGDGGAVVSAGHYRDGLRQGVWTTRAGDVTVAVQGYADGKPDGPWKIFYASGKPMDEGTFTAGERNGTFTHWTEDGSKQYVIGYKAGAPDGTWTLYQPKAKPIVVRWKAGKPAGKPGDSERFTDLISRPETWSDDEPRVAGLDEPFDDDDDDDDEDGSFRDADHGEWAQEYDWGEHEPRFGPGADDE